MAQVPAGKNVFPPGCQEFDESNFWREMTRFLSGEAEIGRGALGDAPP